MSRFTLPGGRAAHPRRRTTVVAVAGIAAWYPVRDGDVWSRMRRRPAATCGDLVQIAS